MSDQSLAGRTFQIKKCFWANHRPRRAAFSRFPTNQKNTGKSGHFAYPPGLNQVCRLNNPNTHIHAVLSPTHADTKSAGCGTRDGKSMEMEPSQLIKGMDVDIGMGLGDDLGGFEGFDAMFAEPNSTSDFFKFCEIEDTQQQHQQDMAITNSAFQGPPSPASTFGHQPKVSEFGQESWTSGGQQQLQIQAWPLTTTLSSSEPTQRLNPNLLLPTGGKPRARKRHDEDEALVSKESVFPVIKVCRYARALKLFFVSRFFRASCVGVKPSRKN